MSKPISAWEKKEQARRTAERRRQNVRRLVIGAVTLLTFAAAGTVGYGEWRAQRPGAASPAGAVNAVADGSESATAAPVAKTPVRSSVLSMSTRSSGDSLPAQFVPNNLDQGPVSGGLTFVPPQR